MRIFSRETGDEDYTCERLNLKQKTTKDYERNAATVYECKNLNDAFADAFLSRDRIRVSLRYFFLGIFELALYSIVIFWIINRACVLLFVGFVRKVFSKAALRNICNTSIDVIATIFFFIAISNEKLRWMRF